MRPFKGLTKDLKGLHRTRNTEIPYPGAGSPATRARCRLPAAGPAIFRNKINFEIFENSEKKHGKLWKNESDKNEVEIAELWPWSGNPNDAKVPFVSFLGCY